ALVLAGCTGPAIVRPTASPTGSIRSQLDDVLTIIANGSNKLGVALFDQRSKASYGFNADYASQSASMAKPMIVLMAQATARQSGAGLDAQRAAQATQAITHSDNDSADALWAYAGGADAYQSLAESLKLPNTRRDPGRGDWSWTWTTPADQVLLVGRLMEGSPAIVEADRQFLWDLMGQVEADQTWGVGTPRSSSVGVHLKNGWVQFKSSDNLWAVNSMGHVSGDGRDYRLAIMTRTADFDTGRETCAEIGRQVFSILGSGPVEPA
ncbi:MAG: serine hydrolase, partial [Propionicimonas sp.]